MTIKTTVNIITSTDTSIVMTRKHITTIQDTPEGTGTNLETTPIDTERGETHQNATGTRISAPFTVCSAAMHDAPYPTGNWTRVWDDHS